MYIAYIYNQFGELRSMYRVDDINSLKHIGIAYTNTVKEYYNEFNSMKYLKEIDLESDFDYKNIIIKSKY